MDVVVVIRSIIIKVVMVKLGVLNTVERIIAWNQTQQA